MLALLLAIAASKPVYLPPQVSVPFPGTTPRIVLGPGTPDQAAEFRWYHQQTLYSPAKTAAAVRFCQEYGKFDQCEVWLIQPGRPHQRLANSNVTRLLWSKDGKYLIGAGANTVRLWNLVGGLRTAVPTPADVPVPLRSQTHSLIRRLWFTEGALCVRTTDGLPRGQRRQTVTRYSLPMLRTLEILSFAAGDGEDVLCRLPITEP